ncbi:hypothetical protein FQR65_LT12632 [Abscondita terminalis]|nr:hypothetical protein FQR65_LT12632 [Abscondita terminalis]
MKFIRFAGYVKAIYMSLDILMIHILLYVTVVAYVMFKDNIDAQKYFSLTTFYASLRVTMGTFFPNAIESIGQNVVSMKRINQFLVCHQISRTTLSTYKKKDTIVELCNASASWTESSSNVLTNLDLSINRRSLTAVVGPVGSGKSSFLNMILKELHLTKGNLKVSGTVSYASQQPWLFSSTIYQNILFGQKLNLTRYNDVLKICALEDDLKVFPNSDKTIVGRRGASLSGGQKARINLARAIYKEADIYLLDDPLSALDANVGKHIFYQCIKEFLKDKTVILVTHQMQYLKHVDRVVVLDKGFVKADGGFETLQKESFFKFAKECVEDFTKQSNVKKNEKERVVEENAEQETGKEKKNIETVSKSVYKDYIMAGGNCLVICLLVLLFLITQLLVSGGTYFMTYWVNIKDLRYQRNITFDFDVTDGFGNFNTTTLDYYEQLDQKYFYVYSLIISILIIVTTTRSFLFFKICAKSSEKLHNSMFDSLIRSTMRFFNTNSAGQILNRFANDMNAVDQNVSSIAMDTIQILITAISSMIMITITNYWLCIPAIVVLLLFYFFKLYCTKTSRSLKRLSSVTHSPILEHLTASLQGLRTIRAQGAQTILKKEFDEHQDLYSCAYSLFTTTSQAFGYLLDCICIIFTAIVISSFLLMGNETYGGNVGLAITQSMIALASFQWGIRQSAELENNMTSVERILEYNSIEHEPQLKRKAPKKWPQLPEIKFVDVCFKYNSEDSPVLKNINFTIKPLEKIGIVGRTGSGKSSLVNALFLLSDLSGSIYIDNIDITTLNLQDLRSKISIIPQDPVIFSGSFRKNLDPFDQYQDDDVWKVLEDVKLKDTVASLPDGLHSTVSDGGSNLSVGERQLICLARAILRNNKILVLDEATANVDSETDEVIQKTIRRKFEKCTVLTIAHRVHTIIDSDRIMVVNNGRIVEFDHPNVLMQNCNGYFYEMVQVSGKDNNN